MPGIGLITALTLLAELGDLKRFKSRAAVANYAGLVPVIRDSNSKHYSGGITHRGSAHLRHVLSEAAWVAVSRVPVYQALFERVAQRRGKQVAIVAVARRMLEDAVRILWKDEAFRFVPLTADSVKSEPARRGTACDDCSAPTASAAGSEVASSVAG
jgi:transposase